MGVKKRKSASGHLSHVACTTSLWLYMELKYKRERSHGCCARKHLVWIIVLIRIWTRVCSAWKPSHCHCRHATWQNGNRVPTLNVGVWRGALISPLFCVHHAIKNTEFCSRLRHRYVRHQLMQKERYVFSSNIHPSVFLSPAPSLH